MQHSIEQSREIRQRALDRFAQQGKEAEQRRFERDFWNDLNDPPARPPLEAVSQRFFDAREQWRHVAMAAGVVALAYFVVTGEITVRAAFDALLLGVLAALLVGLMHLGLVEGRVGLWAPALPRSMWWPPLVAATVGLTAFARASAESQPGSLIWFAPALAAFASTLLISQAADRSSKQASEAARLERRGEAHAQRVWAKHEHLSSMELAQSRHPEQSPNRGINGHGETNGAAARNGTVS
jgi:hypothetical protein